MGGYGPNAQRLLAVKRKWDSGNAFTATPLPVRQGPDGALHA
jgi:hypothetical protein